MGLWYHFVIEAKGLSLDGNAYELWMHFELEGRLLWSLVSEGALHTRELVEFLDQIMAWGERWFTDGNFETLDNVPTHELLG
jgi:hypothetical protein